MLEQTLVQQYIQVISANSLYTSNRDYWEYLLNSYMGGVEYQRGQYLTRYVNETHQEYQARIMATPLENHCKSVVATYISFLFRVSPEREFGTLEDDATLEDFLEDADLDGRSFDNFMKEVSTWASVFGHCWVLCVKPNVGAATLGQEQSQGVRPYVNLVTPLAVLDWRWARRNNGSYNLEYFKYIEEINDTFSVVKEWTKEEIHTFHVNNQRRTVEDHMVEVNGLGEIPAVLVYNHRSPVRGLGISDIGDIATAQQFIYNMTSEVEQSTRINGHPALVKTPGTEASAGAGAIIQIEDNLDPGLKPYILSVSTDTDQIYNSIRHTVEAIDKMANTGSIRSTESRRMSGVAQTQEFELLNAKLSEKADNIELAEENIWQWFCLYQGKTWTGEIKYPGSFNIKDTESQMNQLVKARQAATDLVVLRVIDEHILDMMGEEPERLPFIDPNPQVGRTYPDGEIINSQLPAAYQLATNPDVPAGQNCGNCEYYKPGEMYCTKFDAPVRAVFWCAKWEPYEEEEYATVIDADTMKQIQDMIMSGMVNADIIAALPGITVEDIVYAASEAARNNN